MTPLPHTLRELYPFQSHYLPRGPLRMHYVDEGAGDALLFLHGNPTWSFYYRELIKDLRGQYRCIAPDHIGCGLSDKPQDYPYTLATHIDNTTALVEHLRLENITLLLHDWGGAIGMGLAALMPQRIRRIVLFNTAAFRSRSIPPSIRSCRIPGFGALAVRGFNAFALAAQRWATMRQGGLDASVRAGYLFPYDSYANRVALLRFVQDIPLAPSHPSYDTLVRVENALELFRDHPVLILWGKRDFCFHDEFLHEWQRRFPRAITHVFEHAGHFVVEDALAEIKLRLHDFLRQNS